MIATPAHPILKGICVIKQIAIEMDFRSLDGELHIRWVGDCIPEDTAGELSRTGWHLLSTGKRGHIYIHDC